MSTSEIVLWALLVVVLLAVGAAVATRWFVKRGRHAPFFIRFVNRLTDRLVGVVKRPLTIAVLDEVADVIQTGHYTRNVSDAVVENRQELKALVHEKLQADPNLRYVKRVPGYDALVDTVSETTLRVLIDMLGDPRMDELVSDLLRNNLQQIKRAVRERQHELVRFDPPDPEAPNAGDPRAARPVRLDPL